MGNRVPPKPGPGRPPGARNKVSAALKDMILQSLADLGGVDYLRECGRDKRLKPAYLTLIGRVLPLQIKDGGKDPEVPKPVFHDKLP